MTSSAQQKKHFRSIGHKLKPVVTIAGNGLSENVSQEIERALTDHELIKVKLAAGDRESRLAIKNQLLDSLSAECIQQIGHVLLLYRPARKPNPRLSNLLRKVD